MKKNLSTLDRIVRSVIAIVFFILYISGTVTGVFGVILFAVGGIFLVTGLFGFCPIYALLGLRTLSVHSHKQ